MEIKLALRGIDPKRFALPRRVQKQIIEAMKRREIGVGMDYDRTMVNTNERERIFLSLAEDPAKVIDPMGGLGMLGIPIGVFTGNKPSYINSLCVMPYHTRLRENSKVEAMRKFQVYSQNSTWLVVFDERGATVPRVTEEYAKQYLFPPDHIETIENAFRMPLQQAMADRFMNEKPMVTRPAGSSEVHHAYGPIFENRGGVQLSWIAVPGEIREQVIAEALQQLDRDIRKAYRFEPGGQFSIDINHVHVAKNNGTIHFRKDMEISLLLYFGDSVYKRGEYEGNDLPVVRDEKAIVFAVNPKQEEIPEHGRIIKAGVGPDATRAWLTWILTKYVSVTFSTQQLTNTEKMAMVDAILASGLAEDIQIA